MTLLKYIYTACRQYSLKNNTQIQHVNKQNIPLTYLELKLNSTFSLNPFYNKRIISYTDICSFQGNLNTTWRVQISTEGSGDLFYIIQNVWFLFLVCFFFKASIETRALRGSDYSPPAALPEEKDKLVSENWKDREKKYPRINHAHLHSLQKTSAMFQNN